jgi:Zn-dependent M28 family amino/carboxypeptidase
MTRTFWMVMVAACSAAAVWATEPNAATRNWWSHIRVLAADDMQGRETGSDGHRKAAAYVASRFQRAGLTPAGESGFYQTVRFKSLRFRPERSTASLIRPTGEVRSLRWQHQIGVVPRVGRPQQVDAPLAFTGWDSSQLDVAGKYLVALAPPRLVPGPRGYAQAPPSGYAGTIIVESAAGPEPVRWPLSSSTVMSLADAPLPSVAPGAPGGFQFNPADAEALFEGSGHSYAELLKLAAAGERLPSFPLAVRLRAQLHFETDEISSDNVIARLPGSDPSLRDEYVVVSAHLDGYGIGEPLAGDRIYNGAFDDAAYVATLIDLAERLRESGRRFKRSVLFSVFTAEEKGLLGSQYFVGHPTVPRDQIVANINLDTLRPIFPLTILTTLALDDSTLGDAARRVGETMGIQIRPDLEPDRMLVRRSDQWNFIQAGIPALAFVFGYDPGSKEEATYRRWYAERYHSPLDDLKQPWDPEGAARFNEFFARLLETVANDAARPAWKPGSTLAPRLTPQPPPSRE